MRYGSLVKRFFQSLWSQNRRRAARHALPGLVAYYWNGGPPKPHEVQDISLTGLYLVTEERWYPGTVVTMRLQQKEGEDKDPELAISIHAKAVRLGTDGVGMEIVPLTPPSSQNGQTRGDRDAKICLEKMCGGSNEKSGDVPRLDGKDALVGKPKKVESGGEQAQRHCEPGCDSRV